MASSGEMTQSVLQTAINNLSKISNSSKTPYDIMMLATGMQGTAWALQYLGKSVDEALGLLKDIDQRLKKLEQAQRR